MTERKGEFFEGSIDELLNHCASLDVDEKQCEKEKCLNHIMTEMDVDEEEAEEIYKEIAIKEVEEAIQGLISKGLLCTDGVDDNGEPKYKITELGEKISGFGEDIDPSRN
jgi:hypothetical protein